MFKRQHLMEHNNIVTTANAMVNDTSRFLDQIKKIKLGTISHCNHLINKCDGNRELVDIYAKKRKKDAVTTVSTGLIKEIYRDCVFGPNKLLKEDKEALQEIKNTFGGPKHRKKKYNKKRVRIKSGFTSFPQQNTSTGRCSEAFHATQLSDKIERNAHIINSETTLPKHNELLKEKDNIPTQFSSNGSDEYVKSETKRKLRPSNMRKYLTSSEESVDNLVKRNARLLKALRKLILMRQRDKHKQLWCKYINELKKKHRCDNGTDPVYSMYKDKHNPQSQEQSKLDVAVSCIDYAKIIHDVYGNSDVCIPTPTTFDLDGCRKSYPNSCYESDTRRKKNKTNPGDNVSQSISKTQFCSNKRNTDMKHNQNFPNCGGNYKRNNAKVVHEGRHEYLKNSTLQNKLQNSINVVNAWDDQRKTCKDSFKRVINNSESLSETLKQHSLGNIEHKLDQLIIAINTFILKIRDTKNADVSRLGHCQSNVNGDSPRVANIGDVIHENSRSLSQYRNVLFKRSSTDLNGDDVVTRDVGSLAPRPKPPIIKITYDYIKKTEQATFTSASFLGPNSPQRRRVDVKFHDTVTKDVGSLVYNTCDADITYDADKSEQSTGTSVSLLQSELCNTKYKVINPNIFNHRKESNDGGRAVLNPCSVKITYDLTKQEQATGTSVSLLDTKFCHGDAEDKKSNDCKNIINMAVNTDPLGLFALLRISSESLKRFLSIMPSLRYDSHQPMIHNTQTTKDKVPKFTCNLCGAEFANPSLLSTHILKHFLGTIRHCCGCACHEELEALKRFSCQHCGERFARAYCCDLHQHKCARRLGRQADGRDNLIILS